MKINYNLINNEADKRANRIIKVATDGKTGRMTLLLKLKRNKI
jgi:hypothetical protein